MTTKKSMIAASKRSEAARLIGPWHAGRGLSRQQTPSTANVASLYIVPVFGGGLVGDLRRGASVHGATFVVVDAETRGRMLLLVAAMRLHLRNASLC